MRLNQYIAHHSKYSRREADELIKAGRITIGTQKVTSLATQVDEESKVFIDGNFLKENRGDFYTVIVYNKPKGELVTKRDDRERKVIYDSLPSGFGHFVPVGRLDYASEGVLLLTDSPKVATALMESKLERLYSVKIDKVVTQAMMQAMQEGLSLKDATKGGHVKSEIMAMDFAPFESYEIVKSTPTYSRLKVGITEGKNRELRRFFAHFDANVLDLKRLEYGWVSLNALPEGKFRYLDKKEYKKLHEFMKAKEEEAKPKKVIRVRKQVLKKPKVDKPKIEKSKPEKAKA